MGLHTELNTGILGVQSKRDGSDPSVRRHLEVCDVLKVLGLVPAVNKDTRY